jgi:hypothetical protein
MSSTMVGMAVGQQDRGRVRPWAKQGPGGPFDPRPVISPAASTSTHDGPERTK